MPMIKNPKRVDKSQFPKCKNPSVEARYGLPEDVAFCAKCTYSNQKPNSDREFAHRIDNRKPTVSFDSSGVCSACVVAEQKNYIDWAERECQLIELLDRYRSTSGKYDCIVPGSGGKDSFYTAHVLKYKYGMHPLTVTMTPHLYTPWGWQNFQSWIHAGFDNYLFSPDGKTQRFLTRLALEKLFHPFQPFIMGQMYFPPRIAIQLDIPLVFYGENPIEYGNQIGSGLVSPSKDASFFAADSNSDIYISGVNLKELTDSYGVSNKALIPYLPLTLEQVEGKRLDVQYLGYYLPWHPQEIFYYAMEHSNFKPSPERSLGTFSKYSSIDDKIDDFHYYCTFIKFGIGRSTYDTSQEIRNGNLTREEGVSLVHKYDGEYPIRFANEIFDYLSITSEDYPELSGQFETQRMDFEYFNMLTDTFRSPHLWKYENSEWSLRYQVC